MRTLTKMIRHLRPVMVAALTLPFLLSTALFAMPAGASASGVQRGAAAQLLARGVPRAMAIAVADAVRIRLGPHPGRPLTVHIFRRDPTDRWAFGTAVVNAPPLPDAGPTGYFFIASHGAAGWRAGLSGSAKFNSLLAAAPQAIFPRGERAAFEPVHIAPRAPADLGTINPGNNTLLSLPWTINQTWNMGGGPHAWDDNPNHPFSSLDLNAIGGGNNPVLAAGDGFIYHMNCSNGFFIRIVHTYGGDYTGYDTDYYHMINQLSFTDGQAISAQTQLGRTGQALPCGGSAPAPHVHFSLLQNGSYVSLDWKIIGGWILRTGIQYNGYAWNGAVKVCPGSPPPASDCPANHVTGAGYGDLYNYGPLPESHGIVSTDGNPGRLNVRSGPGFSYPVIGTVSDGAWLFVYCYRHVGGSNVAGTFGTTDVWDAITADHSEWISDAYLDTGVDTVGSAC